MSKQYYIVGRSKGAEDKYFCSCATQGEEMIPWAYSMSKVFANKGDAMRKRDELKPKWKGLVLRVCRYRSYSGESMADRPDYYYYYY